MSATALKVRKNLFLKKQHSKRYTMFKAIIEVEEILKNPSAYKSYSSAKEMFEDLGIL